MGFLLANRPGPPTFVAPQVVGGATEPTGVPTVVFLGDSWGEGTGSDRKGGGLADQVAAAQGWRLVNASQGGTGYVTDGPAQYPDRAPLLDRVADVVGQAPDVVVVAAGINDANRNYPSEKIRAAVDATLTGLRTGLPKARVIVVGPFSPNADPTKSLGEVDRVVADVVTGMGLPFVSPLQDEWITGTSNGTVLGNRQRFIGPDGAHPTQAGHDYLAKKISEFLATVPGLPRGV